MVIEPFVRMGPPPRSPAAEANDCFMVRLPRGATEYKVAARSSRARAGSPRIVGEQPSHRGSTAAPLSPGSKAEASSAHPTGWAIPFRYVTENRACHKVANPSANTPSATPNDRPDIAPAARPSNRSPRSATVGRRTDGPELSAGTTLSPRWSRCKPSMPPGTMRCPTACAKVPLPRPLQAMVDLDFDALTAIVPPRGYGRD